MKYKITHKETGLFVIWDEENFEEVIKILERGHRKVMSVRGNVMYPLTIETASIEELDKENA